MPKVYLLSRTLDPVLAVFTGIFAYHLSENNPRSNIQPGHTLRELIPWQWNQWRAERRAREIGQETAGIVSAASVGPGSQGQAAGGDVDWEVIQRELESDKPSARSWFVEWTPAQAQHR
jgi:hypothetical protein